MGPQFFHCGNRDTPSTADICEQASMGPQFFHCGNPTESLLRVIGDVGLQWGRSSFTAEIQRIREHPPTSEAASMGPQFFHCGNACSLSQKSHDENGFNGAAVLSLRKCPNGIGRGPGREAASMGPQFFHCGNPYSHATMIASGLWLQWGRSSFTAEMFVILNRKKI